MDFDLIKVDFMVSAMDNFDLIIKNLQIATDDLYTYI